MARPIRLEIAGAWYHVTARGNERRDIFLSPTDRGRFLELLGGIAERFGVEVHGYALMNNHFHLLLRQIPDRGLSRAMQWLLVSYTVWFNRRHERVGHLFQGRYKAVMIEFQRWGAEVSRYIHLNPVRVGRLGLGKVDQAARKRGLANRPTAQLVRSRLDELHTYPWTSYLAYAGLANAPGWLHRAAILEKFKPTGGDSTAHYRRFVEDAIRDGHEDSPLDELKAGFLLGSKHWAGKVGDLIEANPSEQSHLMQLRHYPAWSEIQSAVARDKHEPWEQFVNRYGDLGRDIALALARRMTPLTNRELAQSLGNLDDSTVAQAVRRINSRAQTNPDLKAMMDRLAAELSKVKT